MLDGGQLSARLEKGHRRQPPTTRKGLVPHDREGDVAGTTYTKSRRAWIAVRKQV